MSEGSGGQNSTKGRCGSEVVRLETMVNDGDVLMRKSCSIERLGTPNKDDTQPAECAERLYHNVVSGLPTGHGSFSGLPVVHLDLLQSLSLSGLPFGHCRSFKALIGLRDSSGNYEQQFR